MMLWLSPFPRSARPLSTHPTTTCQCQRNNDPQTPWQLTEYISKKRIRKTDRTGNFERGIDTLHTPIGWNKDTQAQIAFSIAAREACVDVAAIYQAVDELNQILPSTITQRLPPANVARMALYKRDHIAQRMVELRSVLPKGDLGQVVAGCPSVLWWPMKQIESTLQELRCLFGGTEDDSEGLMALLEAQPVLLEPGVAGSVCEEMERLFGVGEDPAKRLRMLVRNPSLVLSLMPLHAQERGDRDFAPEMFAAELTLNINKNTTTETPL